MANILYQYTSETGKMFTYTFVINHSNLFRSENTQR